MDDPFVFDDVHVKPIKYIDKEVNYLDRCLVAGWGETAVNLKFNLFFTIYYNNFFLNILPFFRLTQSHMTYFLPK